MKGQDTPHSRGKCPSCLRGSPGQPGRPLSGTRRRGGHMSVPDAPSAQSGDVAPSPRLRPALPVTTGDVRVDVTPQLRSQAARQLPPRGTECPRLCRPSPVDRASCDGRFRGVPSEWAGTPGSQRAQEGGEQMPVFLGVTVSKKNYYFEANRRSHCCNMSSP